MDEDAQLQADVDACLKARALAGLLPDRIAAAELDLRRCQTETDAARRAAVAERADVDRLTRLSPSRIRARLLGSLDADLSRDRAEADAAEYALRLAEGRARQASAHLHELRRQLAEAAATASGWTGLARRRQAVIARTDPALAAELDHLGDERALAEAERDQVQEAELATARATEALDRALQELSSADGWSALDLLGGGLLSGLMKYERLDQAEELMRAADDQLRRLASELRDIGVPAVGDVGIDSLSSTLDVFFDNIFSDWAVANRIAEARDRLTAVASALPPLAQQLRGRAGDLTARVAWLDDRREGLLRSGR